MLNKNPKRYRVDERGKISISSKKVQVEKQSYLMNMIIYSDKIVLVMPMKMDRITRMITLSLDMPMGIRIFMMITTLISL